MPSRFSLQQRPRPPSPPFSLNHSHLPQCRSPFPALTTPAVTTPTRRTTRPECPCPFRPHLVAILPLRTITTGALLRVVLSAQALTRYASFSGAYAAPSPGRAPSACLGAQSYNYNTSSYGVSQGYACPSSHMPASTYPSTCNYASDYTPAPQHSSAYGSADHGYSRSTPTVPYVPCM